MTPSRITTTQGRKHIKQRKSPNTIVVRPKSRLDYLQATDWETFLVRKAVSILLLVELLLRLLLKVWQVDTRGETKVSTFECTLQDILNDAYKMQYAYIGGMGRLYIVVHYP